MRNATARLASPGLCPLVTLLLLLILVGAGAGNAAHAAGEVGLYWDAALTENTALVDPIPGVVTGHLVLRDQDAGAGIVGWELCLDMGQRGQFFDWQLAGQAVNLEVPPCFVVGLGEPLLPAGGAMVLATFQFLATEFRPIVFTAGPAPVPSLPGQMSFIRADAPTDLQALGTVTGTPAIAWINPDNPWPEIAPALLDFGVQPVGLETRLAFVVTNAGGGALDLETSLAPGCAEFSLPDSVGSVSLAPGQSAAFAVAFMPPAVGSFACTVGLGGQLPTVTVQGTGREPIRDYTLSTTRYFGTVGVGGSRVLSAILRNTGEVPLPVAPELSGCGDVFTIVDGGAPGTVAPGSQLVVNVRFSPADFDTVRCDLIFGPDLAPVTLVGSGREPVIGFDVPAGLDFGNVLVGERLTRGVTVANTGEIPFTVAPALTDCGANFEFEIGSGGAFALVPGESGTVRIVCTPRRQEALACTLGLGPDLPAVALTAGGILSDTDWSITPAHVVFPVTLPGATRDTTVVFTYFGADSLAIDPRLTAPAGAFSILSGSGARVLGPNEQQEIVIRFAPTAESGYATSLSVGDILPLVPLSGAGGQPVSSCAVAPTALDFGTFLINNSRSREFVITNTGNQPVDVAPGTDSAGYVVSGTPRRLNAGQAATYTVTLTPSAEGVWNGLVTTGEVLCPEVTCTGVAVYPDVAGNDVVGIFFDRGFSLNEIDLPVYTPHAAYVVLFNPTEALAVSGWECAIELTGNVIALDWTFAGNGTNTGLGTDFRVGLNHPLPLSPTVELAHFQVVVLYPYGTILMLMSPATNPAIAGEMSWRTFDGRVIPMQSYTGEPVVALVNEGHPVAVQAPTPQLTLDGGQVQLEWSLVAAPGTGCHVYRRADGAAEQRLTSQPLMAGTGTFTYTDEPVGFTPGARLYYSYALVVDGRETARSPEADVDVAALPNRTTRLLPNAPNPFNPRTEIRFELATPAEVDLVVYDLSGRVVRTLIAGESLPAARHVRAWRGRDDGGRAVASGVYFCRFEAGAFRETRRMVLMK